MDIRFLFYKPDFDGHLLDDGIAQWTRLWNPQTWGKGLLCSHAEIWVSNTLGKFNLDSYKTGSCYTSTMQTVKRNKYNGVRMAHANEILKHPVRWYYYEVPINGYLMDDVEYLMGEDIKNNKGYDKKAILSYFTPWRFGATDKYICSEFCGDKIYFIACHCEEKWAVIFRDLYKPCPSPLRLSYWLWKSGLEKHNLT